MKKITFAELEALKREPEREPVKPMINGVMPQHAPLPVVPERGDGSRDCPVMVFQDRPKRRKETWWESIDRRFHVESILVYGLAVLFVIWLVWVFAHWFLGFLHQFV